MPALFGEIHIARAVRSEVVAKGKGRAGAAALGKASWVSVTQVSRRALATLRSQATGLHTGELETIGLASQLRADLVLIDERLARNLAASNGLQVLGTLGILKYAYQQKLLPDLRDALDDLRSKGFRFTDELYTQILSE